MMMMEVALRIDKAEGNDTLACQGHEVCSNSDV